MNRIKKVTAFILIFATIMSQLCYGADMFTLKEALFYGQTKSFFKGDLRKSTMSIKEKKKAIVGAKAGGGLSLSLDFMKIFEDDPPYQKTFGNITKGPTAVYNYNVERLKQPFTLRRTEYNITTAYFAVYKAKIERQRKQSQYNEENQKYNEGKIKLQKGEINEEILDEQKKKVDDATKSMEKSEVDFQNKVQKIGDLVYLKNNLKYSDYKELKPFVSGYYYNGSQLSRMFSSGESIAFKNLTKGYDYEVSLRRARVGSDDLSKLVNKAIKMSWEVKAIEEQLKIEECYINACMDLYKQEYGYSHVSQFDAMIKGGIENIDDLDFTLKYDKFVDYLVGRYGEGWKPYFGISLIFFTIKIPKLFKFDQYDGVRFLEDSRYELQQRVMQFLQLLMDLETQKKTVTELASDLFYSINNLDQDYENLKNQFASLESAYKINETKYKSGLIKADVLIGQKDELNKTDDKINDTLMQMNEKILELNYMTGGDYWSYTVDSKDPTPKTKGSPFRAMAIDDITEAVDKLNEEGYTITWAVQAVAEDDSYVSTIDFGLTVKGSGFNCDEYQIVTTDGIEISEKLKISEKFRHFATTLDDKIALKVKFFSGGNKMFTGTMDGYGNIGQIIRE